MLKSFQSSSLSFHSFVLMLTLCVLACLPSRAQTETTYPQQVHLTREEVSGKEKAANFGMVYLAQWAVYYATQKETIEAHGSWENWKENTFRAHFDRDHFDYNIIKHTLTGQYYYLWYRSRGYTEKNSFLWATISSLAFEFTIETMTEQPSYQDIYQTPVFGTVVGMTFERLSTYFHSLGTLPTSFLGYIFNPFSLFPGSHFEIRMTPEIHKDRSGVVMMVEF